MRTAVRSPVGADPGSEGSAQEVVDISVQNALGVTFLHAGAQVLHHLVGLKYL